MSTKGQLIKTFSADNKKDFLCCTLSPRGDYLYAATEDNTLYCFNMLNGSREHIMDKLHEKEVLGICHHPHLNLLATYSDEGTLKLWKP